MAHADSFIINIAIADMYRLYYRILDFSNAFQNKKFPIHEILFVSPTPYYLDWFDKYYPNVLLNIYEGPFCLQCMNGIQGTKPAGLKFNRLLDVLVPTLKYNKGTIYHSIYIKVFYDGTVSYIKVSTDDILNTYNNETKSPELIRVFEEAFEIKFQVGSVLKYINFRIFQSPLGFSVDKNYHIMKLVNELFPAGNF